MPDKKLTDSEIVKALECCVNEKTCKNCAYSGRSCLTPLKRDTLDLINRLQAENERLKELCDNIRTDKSFLGKEITKYHKELLKSKVFKYVRNPNRIYTIMDFKDGEILRFYDYPEQPNALASEHYKFQGKNDIRLIHISEVKDLSYEEIKAEAYKECIEKAKSELKNISKFDFHGTDYYLVGEAFFDNILKELVGD